MNNTILQGKITFVNHEKEYVIIEYEKNGKKKTIKGNVDDATQLQLKEKKIIKKTHTFHIGDIVNFISKISDSRDKMIAVNIQYLYNTALDALINKAKTENNFTGYLKIADGKYFVKEISSYLFFPVSFSLWQIMPAEDKLNEVVTFSLENLEKKDKITAKLFNSKYVPEFYSAVKFYKAKTPIEAIVHKITSNGIYLNVIGDKVQAKISANPSLKINIGDKVNVVITYIGNSRIIVEIV